MVAPCMKKLTNLLSGIILCPESDISFVPKNLQEASGDRRFPVP